MLGNMLRIVPATHLAGRVGTLLYLPTTHRWFSYDLLMVLLAMSCVQNPSSELMSLCWQASVNSAFTDKPLRLVLLLQALRAETQASDSKLLHQAQATNDGLTGKLSRMATELDAAKQAQLDFASQLESAQVHALLAKLTCRVAGFC